MAGVFVPWLVDAARLTGYPVVEVAGWQARGHGGLASVEAVVCHHTAGPAAGEAPSLAVVRDGRADLAGPLSHLVLGRSGTVYVVAAGKAWHAGTSTWDGLTALNERSIGIEAESVGNGHDWTAQQRDCYPRLVAALLHYMRRPAWRAAGHAEVAVPPGRKIDPTGIDMSQLRATVARMLDDPMRRIPRGATTQESDDLTPEQTRMLTEVHAALTTRWATWDGGTGEQLTLPDLARRANVEVRQVHPSLHALHVKVDALNAKLDQLLARPPALGVDPAEVREAVTEALADGLTLSVVPAAK
jgi:hypothetical protein